MTYRKGQTATNQIWKPQIFDLTEMYGSGNEPTTVAQFRQDFPDEMYDYSPHCFVKSYKTLLKASDYCQLLDKSKYPSVITNAGVTTISNGDGSITINGTATKSYYINCTPPYPQRNNGHVFYVCANNKIMSSSTWYYGLLNQSGLYDYGKGVIGKTNALVGRSTGIVFNKGVVFDNVIIKPQILDLTEMYGAGNEPTTVAQFRENFPNELYDYKPYSTIPSYKKSLVCKTKNLFDINSVIGLKHVGSGVVRPTTLWSIQDNVFSTRINTYSQGGNIFTPNLSLYPGIYTLSTYCISDQSLCTVGIYNFTQSNWIDKAYKTNQHIFHTFEITEKSEIGLMLQGYNDGFIGTFSNIQLELGSTATDYVPYGHL